MQLRQHTYKNEYDTIRAVIAKATNGMPVAITMADYYPFGSKMPNRTTVGDYRYSFQGQELDQETSMEAFELRLWDDRIGRWLTVDPYGEFFSPYLGMGNNPILIIDPDGGVTEGPCPPICDSFGGESTVLDTAIIIAHKGNDVSSGLLTQLINLAQESQKQILVFNTAALNAIATNMAMGAGRANASNFGDYELTFRIGQLTGDVTSVFIGDIEMNIGSGGTVAGLLLEAPSGGSSSVVSVGGYALAGHGASVVISGSWNTAKSIRELADYMHSGGKNSSHANQKAKASTKQKYEQAKSELEALKRKPNKTPQDKNNLIKLTKRVKQLKSKADFTGENHSNNAKGNRR